MKKIYQTIIVFLVIFYGAIYYFVIGPSSIKVFKTENLGNFAINVPKGFAIKKLKNSIVLKKIAKIGIAIVDKKNFNEKRYFNNYQSHYDLPNGKLFFYLRNKSQYIGIYLIKGEKVLWSRLYVNSNLSNWIELFLNIFKKEIPLSDSQRKNLYLSIKKQYHMQDNTFMLIIFGGTIVFFIFFMLVISNFSAKPPKDLLKYEQENIVMQKKVMARFSRTLSHQFAMVYTILTEKNFYVFYFGKEFAKISKSEFQGQLINKQIIIQQKSYKIAIPSKEFNENYLSGM